MPQIHHSPMHLPLESKESDSYLPCCSPAIELFIRSKISKIYRRCIQPYTTLIYSGSSLIAYLINSRVFHLLFSSVSQRFVSDASHYRYYPFTKGTSLLQLFAIAIAPIAIYSIAKEGYKVIRNITPIDAGLKMLEGIGWLSDCLSTFLYGIQAAGITTTGLAISAFSFTMIGGLFSLATLALNIKRLVENHHLCSLSNTNLLAQMQKGKSSAWAAHFQALPATLRERISSQRVAVSAPALKRWIHQQRFSHYLSMLSILVSFVAISLFFFPLLVPASYTLLASAAALLLLQFFFVTWTTHQLKKNYP
jgi:hypothetical protein